MIREEAKKRILAAYAAVARLPLARGRITMGRLLLRLLRLQDPEVILGLGPYRIPLDLSEASAQFAYFGAYQRAETSFLRNVLRPGWTVLDVGAHVGYFAATMARAVAPGGRVFAFEPDPRNFARLQKTCFGSDSLITPIPLAVVSPTAPKRVTFYSSSRSTTWSSTIREMAGSDSRVVEVAASTIDEALATLSAAQPSFVKIDVEGAELGVLQGMSGCLSHQRPPIIACELKFDSDHATGRGALELLLGRGYRAHALPLRSGVGPLASEELRSLAGTVNLSFLPAWAF